MTTQLFPTQTVSFYEMLTFIGCKESDALFYSEVYAKYSEATESNDFMEMLLAIGMDLNYLHMFSIVYFDTELLLNVVIVEVEDTERYLISQF